MKLYIDSANIESISWLNEYYPIAGVTTNPSILVKEEKPYLEVLKEIRSIIGNDKELFVQALGDKAEEILDEARFITNELSGNLIVKVPVTEEGIKAIKLLTAENIPSLATTVYTAFQALIAAKSGAKYVAPYVNRIDNLSGNGGLVVKEISELFTAYGLSCEILAASFKNLQQVHDVCLAGAEAVTVAPDIIESMVAFPSTASDVVDFKRQWVNAFGENRTNLTNT
ncbi:fructose-6-phosphate aldolase [Oceanobacillus piezotolerans]|uniref:Fructose-6-phosphate aldolase n=1 Tax=Oceanobacillus piezotolerans TaxID=2448030 RepID=A0A498D1W1_9BACI|nr:transaldolase family protein [Oceanobacillus piezotolerans]RLL41130.1 fructose-6-phosphate aldolase [Oceanobacillus piezotolerans]